MFPVLDYIKVTVIEITTHQTEYNNCHLRPSSERIEANIYPCNLSSHLIRAPTYDGWLKLPMYQRHRCRNPTIHE